MPNTRSDNGINDIIDNKKPDVLGSLDQNCSDPVALECGVMYAFNANFPPTTPTLMHMLYVVGIPYPYKSPASEAQHHVKNGCLLLTVSSFSTITFRRWPSIPSAAA